MSIKTLRKRIALVAVSALGAGLMTVASVAPANAATAAGGIIPMPITSGQNTALTACTVSAASGVDTAVIPLTSAGLILSTSSAGVTTSDTAYVSISGPAVIQSLGSNLSSLSQTSATTAATGFAGAGDAADRIVIKPTAVGTVKVTYSLTSTSGALDVITITVVDKCNNYALNVGGSLFLVTGINEATATAATFAARTTDNDRSTIPSGELGYVRMRLADVYGDELLSTKVLQANVTGANCLVNLQAASTSASPYSAGDSNVDLTTDSGRDDVVVVSQSDSDVPAVCQVSASYDGNLIGTKTFTFRGIPAKITVSDITVGATSGVGYYRVAVQDSAGNPLPGVVISASSTEANNAASISSGVITSAQSNSGAATYASTTATSTLGTTREIAAASLAITGANGPTTYACSALGGSAKLTVRAVINSATASYLTSAPFNVMCSGALATWSISMDKASYAPGEIATLTLSGKDSGGRPVSTFTSLSGVAYAFGGMTAVTAPTNGDVFASGAGIKTYQFSVGTTEGSFVGSFTTTGTTDTAAKTVQYKVANPNAAVSTNEVLAAIVKLIATINKQIRQLQKQLRR